MKKLIVLGFLVLGISLMSHSAWALPCDEWGEMVQGIFCKIHEDKIQEYYNTYLTPEQVEILYEGYPVGYSCLVKTISKNDIQRSANFHLRPHENSPILVKYGLPHGTKLERLEFIHRPEGSLYNWVKVKHENVVGYVAKHTVECDR